MRVGVLMRMRVRVHNAVRMHVCVRMRFRAGATAQLLVDLLELWRRESGFAPRAPRRPQAVGTGALPQTIPAAHALAADLQAARHEGLDFAEAEQSGGLLSSGFKCLEIASRTERWLHAPSIHAEPIVVTILCESQ